MGGMARKQTQPLCYSAWPTAWGPMGAVAGPKGLLRLLLPHYQLDEVRELLAWEHPGATPNDEPFAALAERSRAYFNGEAVSFDDLPCDLPGERTFSGQVLRACRAIPYGRTVNYGQLAKDIGRPDAARAVAGQMSKNPLPLVIPCHRVTYADGRLGGFSAPGGVDLKRRMLALEANGPGA